MNKISIVGFGPGNAENMTALCKERLEQADVIVGYTGYIEMLKPFFPDKNFHGTGMRKETDRCRDAVGFALEGKTVCVVSSGDAAVYGMAGLIFELAFAEPESGVEIEIEVVPGVTAALSGAALLGSPLTNDFAVVSLSDQLTSRETIEKRLRAAAAGDFVLCMYNPGSHTRTDGLRNACDILLETIPADRLCGIARNIGRAGQSFILTTLGELRGYQADMTETIFIGNSYTRNIGGRMVTVRGYSID